MNLMDQLTTNAPHGAPQYRTTYWDKELLPMQQPRVPGAKPRYPASRLQTRYMTRNSLDMGMTSAGENERAFKWTWCGRRFNVNVWIRKDSLGCHLTFQVRTFQGVLAMSRRVFYPEGCY